MDSATYKVLCFLFLLPSGLWFFSSIGLSLSPHWDWDSNGPPMLKNRILKGYKPYRPVLTCRGVFDKSERKRRARGMALDDVTSHLTWTWRYSWYDSEEKKEDKGKLHFYVSCIRAIWRIENGFLGFPSPFSGMEPGTCPGVLVQWRWTNLVMFLTLPRPMEWQTRWCHHRSQVSHWAAASLAPSGLHVSASGGLVLLKCTFKNMKWQTCHQHLNININEK